jgi:hypothetical protein
MYALKGQISDGILVRISSISPDAGHAYGLQRDFAESMLEALSPEQRKRLIGLGVQ